MDSHRLKQVSLVQSAWVVPDLKVAMRKWLDLGYGPFLTFDVEATEMADWFYRGKPAPVSFSVALTHGGGIQIELIQQRSPDPSIYREMYAPGQGGLHHYCILTNDYTAELARLRRQGLVVLAEGKALGVHCCFADARETLGGMLEVVEDLPVIQQIYKNVAAAAKEWDGSHPIRPFKFGSDPILT